ncbi:MULTISPECIES: SDR family NAD(P)-dependent oxidoreductase [unclassified Pseudomonas]|uniref:SDR family NAD(P)-dependent oxidoreductase n=1 Tax=unclassified Pseudomonas TaxID=196821 RepID=UPI00244ADD53|nr:MULTISPECIES: SDR family NAD(P)-dependent oxidoreductase [unclassified Pseudomonas]MDG9928074.1 SDR family oxidoreductase [Pseudomonas sp. GD04042]MDH0482083.1 SDR family oxidoreductase [Pseudomonas sp. GD04015]MDH0604022.1 SDR family oxidoreductase [Pseudomonas sp. GD03869]
MIDYRGKRVLLTGAASGIGRGLARAFAEQGATLELLDRNAEALAAVADELAPLTDVAWTCVELGDSAAVAAYVERRGHLPLDVLINNAGVEYATPLAETGAEADARWQALLDNNVASMLRLTRALQGQLRDGASVINQASIWGLKGVPGFSAYVASKHAVIGLTRSLAWELGPRRIRVNAVCPGWIGTDAAMRSLAVMAQASGRSEADELALILAAQAVPELLTPADLAGTFLFLGSALAAPVTGQALSVSHGEVMH